MKKIFLIAILTIGLFFFITPYSVNAANATGTCEPGFFKSSITGECIPETTGSTSTPADVSCKDNNQFKSFISGKCLSTYEEWLAEVWGWAMMIMIPLSVLVLSIAGVLYMVSEGDSNRVALAKKLIIGVLSGVGVLILARVILAVIGVEGPAWNISSGSFNIMRGIWNV